MKIVQGNEVPAQRGVPYRGGTSHQRRVLEGEPGTLGNFSLTMSEREGDYYSPRHRHNFEQIRFQLAGMSDYGRTGKLSFFRDSNGGFHAADHNGAVGSASDPKVE